MLTRRGSAALTTLLSKRADVSRQGLASAWSPSFGGQSAISSQALVWSALQLLPLRVRPSCGLHCIRCIRVRPSCGLHRIASQQCTVACLRMYRLHGGAEWRLVQKMAVLPPPLPAACCCRHRHRRRRSSGPVRRHCGFSRIAVAMRRCQCAHWHASQSQRADTALRFHPQKKRPHGFACYLHTKRHLLNRWAVYHIVLLATFMQNMHLVISGQ